MAISSRNSNMLVYAFVSIGVLSSALIVSRFLPAISEFLISELPVFWSSVRSWLTPPYLYFVINCIIIGIVASSRLYKAEEKTVVMEVAAEMVEEPELVKIPTVLVQNYAVPTVYVQDESVILQTVQPEFDSFNSYDVEVVPEYEMQETVKFQVKETPEFDVVAVEADLDVEVKEEEEEEEEFEIPMLSLAENRTDSMEIVRTDSMEIVRTDSMENLVEHSFGRAKPPVSSRFGHHRKIVRGTPEAGKALKVSKPKRHDTLESTWKMITEGRSIPLARHLKKSDTWETHSRPHNNNVGHQHDPLVKKAETFNDRTSNTNNQQSPSMLIRSAGSGKLKKDPSLSQEELNRRVEAFIKNFNEEMRLQRLESLKQYKEMTNRV